MIQYYELIYIIPVKYAGKEFEKIQNKIKEIIQQEGGQIAYEENLGKKKLSYSIKRNSQGFYIINEFEIESDKAKNVNNKIKLTQEVIRHLILKKKKLTDEERQKEKIKREKQETQKDSKNIKMTEQFNIEKQLCDSNIKPEIPQKEEDAELMHIEKETYAKKISGSEKKEEHKIKLEDLDKKLDTIINDNII